MTRLAVCSWSLRPADPAGLVERLRRLGVPAVQLDLTTLCRAPQDPMLDTLQQAGITIVSGMMSMEGEDYASLDTIARTGGVRPDATWNVNRTRAEMVASLAQALGLPLVTFHAGFLPDAPDDPERARLLDRLRTIADLFADAGVTLGLETGQETAATLEDVLQELDRPNVGVNFDPANMILYDKGDPVDAIERLAPHVVQVHIKDAVPTTTPGTWGTEVPAGTGAVDWPAFFAVTERLSPAVTYVIEREAGDDRDADIARARDLVLQQVPAAASAPATGGSA